MPCSAKMDAREKDSGRWSDMWCLHLTFPELFWWWRLISSVFLTRTSCRRTTHANKRLLRCLVSVLPLPVGTDTARKKSELWSRLGDPSQNTEEDRSALRSCWPTQRLACGEEGVPKGPEGRRSRKPAPSRYPGQSAVNGNFGP